MELYVTLHTYNCLNVHQISLHVLNRRRGRMGKGVGHLAHV